jgi:hypothetical protein
MADPWTPNPHQDIRPEPPIWAMHSMGYPGIWHDPKWNDKDYMAQVGMGDIEFEMDMYDYLTENNDQLALQGLREHVEYGGPFRYMDMSPQNREFYLGMYTGGGEGYGPRRIDINLENIIDMNEKSRMMMRGRVPHEIDESGEWGLRNAIFDLYAHEYGHGIKRLNQFRDLDLEHPTIFYNTGQKGKHPGMVWDSKMRAETWPRRYPDEPPGPWNDFQPTDPNSPYTMDWLNRDMSDIAEDIIDETTMYHGRSPMDENLMRLPWQDQPDDHYNIGKFGEF